MRDELVKRLRGTLVAWNASTTKVSVDGVASISNSNYVTRLRNPDGPQAADQIEADGRRIAVLEAALRQSREGWLNAAELGIIAPRHRGTALVLADNAGRALAEETSDA